MNEKKNQTNFEINQVINQPYKYGFETKIEKEKFPVGINEEIINLISDNKKEPKFIRIFRQKSLKQWKKMSFPNWANLTINDIDFNGINYYSIPKKKKRIKFFK